VKKILLIVGTASLVGCSLFSPDPFGKLQNTTVHVDKDIPAMTRNEIINAVNECEGNGLRPVMITARRKVNGYVSEVTAEVTCAPKYIK
jgi:hypothetical protein